ncbi:ATP-binding cassette domain-containing protein [Microtetraspora sp. NBRC 16547]|uniref:ATP-binding cassette domain-containing protein n=1 Tax=Microtetraspora sp. NBRC 16547 TaxID=3030993 RepID=UPI0024A09880|nr:ATP-binding cassette domain-containing protein [Microtetraspora sp. NBRC 16547]GLX02400.1 ABC transporter ATP-binding protein [Microtetraspora sp. NBRC 16547]
MSTTAENVIEISGLCKQFTTGRGRKRRTVRALDDVSLTVADGSCLAVVGESGSGKSTLARVLVGLERADAGEVVLAGRPVAQRPRRAERRARARDVQMVFQDPSGSLNRRRTVEAAIGEVLAAHHRVTGSDARRRIDDLLDQVGLRPAHARALPGELSGGQQQRVAIARALAAEPRVLVLDEAVAALDVSVQAQVLNLLAEIRRARRLTYLFITHDLSVVRQVSDEVVVMRRGQVVERGSTDQVLDHPRHPYTVLLRDSAPRPGWRPRLSINSDISSDTAEAEA